MQGLDLLLHRKKNKKSKKKKKKTFGRFNQAVIKLRGGTLCGITISIFLIRV